MGRGTFVPGGRVLVSPIDVLGIRDLGLELLEIVERHGSGIAGGAKIVLGRVLRRLQAAATLNAARRIGGVASGDGKEGVLQLGEKLWLSAAVEFGEV